MERDKTAPKMVKVIETNCPDGDLSALLDNMYYDQQKSSRQIGCDLGVSADTVRNWMEQFGIQRRVWSGDVSIGSRNYHKALERLQSAFGDNPKAVLEYMTNEEDLTDRQIAERTGYSNTTINTWKKRLGVLNSREKRGGHR